MSKFKDFLLGMQHFRKLNYQRFGNPSFAPLEFPWYMSSILWSNTRYKDRNNLEPKRFSAIKSDIITKQEIKYYAINLGMNIFVCSNNP